MRTEQRRYERSRLFTQSSERKVKVSKILHQSRAGPNVRIVPLVPVHETLSARNPRMRSPTATKHNVVLAVEEIRRVGRVESHRLEPSMLLQHGASPFPNTAQFALTRELVAILGHRNRVPVFESHVCAFEVHEKRRWGWASSFAGGAVEMTIEWWSFFNTVIDKMTIAD